MHGQKLQWLSLSALILLLITVTTVTGLEVSPRIVAANEVQAKIETQQPIEYDNCIIKGDLNLHSPIVNMPIHFNGTIFQDPIQFNSRFNGPVYFHGSQFERDADFSYSYFGSNADFISSQFKSSAKFYKSTFNDSVNFNYAKFANADFSQLLINQDAFFTNCNFNNSTTFYESQFESHAYFSHSHFNGDADFIYSKFESDADFSHSRFNGDAYFTYSEFESVADFSLSYFDGDAHFVDTIFNGDARFWHSQFISPASFVKANFSNDADFTSSQFNGGTSFKESYFNKTATFNNSQIDKSIDFGRSMFKKSLYLYNGFDFDQIHLEWSGIKDINRFIDNKVYLSMIEDLKRRGFYDDADDCYFEIRKEQCLGRDLFEDPFMFLLDRGGWIFYGYGKKPLYPLGWSAGSILIFGVFWYIASMRKQKNANDEYSTEFLKQGKWGRIHSILNLFFFSATIFLSGTKLFVDPPEVPPSSERSRSVVKAMFNLERALGAFFFVLLFLAISGTIIR